MTSLKLQSTTIRHTASGVRVRVLIADGPDPDAALQKILIDLPVELGEGQRLLEYQAAALRDARSAIDAEMSETERRHIRTHT